MGKIILFGGGDGGGLRIGPNGVEPIPPYNPAIRLQLRALHQLVQATNLVPKKVSSKLLTPIVSKLTSALLGQIEPITGEIDADNGLVYQDVDGGFTCGSTGKPPIPFPWPVGSLHIVDEVLARGILKPAALTFLEQAARHKLDVFAVTKNPEAAAKRMGIVLTSDIKESLSELALDRSSVDDEYDRELLDLYRKVVTDGRFIEEWTLNPSLVAEKLKVKVSQPAIDRLIAIRDRGAIGVDGPGTVMCPYAVAVVIAVVIVVARREFDLPVRDLSGTKKF